MDITLIESSLMPYVPLRLYLAVSGEPALMYGTWDALYVTYPLISMVH